MSEMSTQKNRRLNSWSQVVGIGKRPRNRWLYRRVWEPPDLGIPMARSELALREQRRVIGDHPIDVRITQEALASGDDLKRRQADFVAQTDSSEGGTNAAKLKVANKLYAGEAAAARVPERALGPAVRVRRARNRQRYSQAKSRSPAGRQ